MIITANAVEAATIQRAARNGAGIPASDEDGNLTARRSMRALWGLIARTIVVLAPLYQGRRRAVDP
jgi:hypothetical protein